MGNVHKRLMTGIAGMETDRVRAPNIRDVAALAGVSYQTVSRVLNDSPSIRPSTRERVLAVIQEVGYRPNQAARALVTSRSGMIGVLSTQSTQYGPTTSVNAIEEAARDAGYRLSITTVSSGDASSMAAGVEYLLSQAVEAIVMVAPQVGLFEALSGLSIAVPFVTLESTGRDSDHSLSVDQVAGARLATEHLVRLGHTEIAHLAGPGDWIEANARREGFRLAIGAAGLREHPVLAGDWSAQSGYEVGLRMLVSREITAVFASNDQMALGLVHAANELGIGVPADLSVVGFDDIPEAAHFLPALTTVRQDFAEIGRRAVAQLLADLRGGGEVHEHGRIPPELVARGSTAAR
jgi:DNA-binding LacI/PurR family transcriptional regulator